MPFDDVLHVIILPNYKETQDTLCETLDILASHPRALTQYKICLAMEEGEDGATEKARRLILKYASQFREMTFTLHPKGLPGEIRGKSSNVAWAASRMADAAERYGHQILTIMDADTCFAADYFEAVTYHFCTASSAQRRVMMFAPTIVFDRNLNDVPVFVRVTDMLWSICVMSGLYTDSPIKFPCSAYSVTMELAVGVGMWDAGPEAIGEDMHMYLKCWFSTRGKVIVKSIFSPASQSDIEGSGTGIGRWISGMFARFTQAKRHMWGSLDFVYALRRGIYALLAPNVEDYLEVENLDEDTKAKKNQNLHFSQFLTLMHRLLEAHMLFGHFFLILLLVNTALPFVWSYLGVSISTNLQLILDMCGWVRLAVMIPNVAVAYYYERYHQWVGIDRWLLQKAPKDLPSEMPSRPSTWHAHLTARPLGKRAQLVSARKLPFALLEWPIIFIAAVFYFIIPQIIAQVSHIFTDKLEYKVAAKPLLLKSHFDLVKDKNASWHADDMDSLQSSSSKGDEGFFEDSDATESNASTSLMRKDIRTHTIQLQGMLVK